MTGEPTIATIPSILLRTGLRLLGRILLTFSTLFLILGLGLALVSLLLATWRTSRGPRVQLVTDLILTVTALAKTFRD